VSSLKDKSIKIQHMSGNFPALFRNGTVTVPS
jgi:hypothetical protein